MKKLVSLLLVLAMILSVGVLSFACQEETVPFFDGSGADYWGPDCLGTPVSLKYASDADVNTDGVAFSNFGKNISVKFSKEFLESVNASDLRYIWFTLCEDDVTYKIPDYYIYFHDFENNGDVSFVFGNTFVNGLEPGTHTFTITVNGRVPFDVEIEAPAAEA